MKGELLMFLIFYKMKIEINLLKSDFVLNLYIIAYGVADDEILTGLITWCGAKVEISFSANVSWDFPHLQSEALIRGIASMQNCHVC